MADIIIFGIVLLLGLLFYLKNWLIKKLPSTKDKINTKTFDND